MEKRITHVVEWEERDEFGEWGPMSANAYNRADAETFANQLHQEGAGNIRITLLPGDGIADDTQEA